MEDDSSPFNTFGKGFKRIFGKGRWTAGEDLTEQEIMSMVNEGHENGVLQESEAEMINNIFTLDQKEAKDIMTCLLYTSIGASKRMSGTARFSLISSARLRILLTFTPISG